MESHFRYLEWFSYHTRLPTLQFLQYLMLFQSFDYAPEFKQDERGSGSTSICLHFLYIPDIHFGEARIIEILFWWKIMSFAIHYPTWLLPWLLVTCWHKEPWHQYLWYWCSSHKTFHFITAVIKVIIFLHQCPFLPKKMSSIGSDFGTWIDEVMVLRWFSTSEFALTHWVNYNVIAADNGLSPVQRQTISWTNDGLFPNQTLRDMFQWNFIGNSNVFVYENAFENVICKNGGQLASASMCSRLDQHILWSTGNGRYNLIGDANKHRAKHANNISRRHLIKPAVALLHCSIL